ncbi:hypothetical protein [Dokdonella sp.]|uniref:hypothetical protein n=1 Tax=Dokdonella sp. TaxID=2291710 RepID=UPI001B0AEF01|nr:hypothetical protein [Dokdonella sp.]MBO9664958.1 hypothetical protein [Dokdonella sp.]
MQTIYVVETYKEAEGQLWPERAVICRSDQDAIGRARMLSESATGVIAYSQLVDPDAGDYDQPVILAQHGSVPSESRAI